MRWAPLVLVVVACSPPSTPKPPDPQLLARAVWRGDAAAVRDLLDRGADPEAVDKLGHTPLSWAVTAGDHDVADVLFERVPHLQDRFITRTLLRIAAGRNDVDLVEKLLAHGASTDGTPDHRASALVVAAANGSTSSLRRLLAAHADPSYADPDGDTALDAATRAGSLQCIDLLLAAGAKSARAVWWARATDQPELAAHLVERGLPDVPAPSRPPPPTAAEAIARAVPLIQKVDAQWTADGECTACHHAPMAVRSIAIVEKHGFPVDTKLARAAEAALHKDDDQFAAAAMQAFSQPDALLDMSMFPAGDPAFGNAWFLAAELGAGLPAGKSQQVLASWQAGMQQRDGHWRAGPFRGVIEWDDAEATSLAIEAIAGYGDAAAKRTLEGARTWLEHAGPLDDTVVDVVAHLRAAHALGLATDAADTLRARQHADGSWGHTLLYGPGDAYSTAYAAVALIETGTDPHDPAVARAVDYLLRTQQPDGSWLVWSRSAPLNPYHDRGFPHARMQFISFAATAWAITAIAESR